MKPTWSRREFIAATSTAMLLGAAAGARGEAGQPVPKRRLGRTGELVSCLAFGGGSRFCNVKDEDAAQALLERAFAAGVNYFDTASSYGKERLSERRYATFLKSHRKAVFLTSKVKARTRDAAWREVEQSLRTLQTDHLDLIQIHALNDVADLDAIGKAGGALEAVQQLKEQKLVRFFGITGHNDGRAMAEALRRHDFDTVLMALNAAQSANPLAQPKMGKLPAFEQEALPIAVRKNMGIIAMKVMAQGLIVGDGPGKASAAELLQHALSLPISTAVVGYDHLPVLEENIRTALAFQPLSEEVRAGIRRKVAASESAWRTFLQDHEDGVPV